jgi:hypothetical protein
VSACNFPSAQRRVRRWSRPRLPLRTERNVLCAVARALTVQYCTCTYLCCTCCWAVPCAWEAGRVDLTYGQTPPQHVILGCIGATPACPSLLCCQHPSRAFNLGLLLRREILCAVSPAGWGLPDSRNATETPWPYRCQPEVPVG